MKRRQYLSVAGSGIAIIGSGCIGNSAPGNSHTDEPISTPSDCEGHSRFSHVDGVTYDEYGDFTIRTDSNQYSIGDEMVAQLTNVSDEKAYTGTKEQYDIQKKYGDEWVSIYWSDGFSWVFTGTPHSPGDGFKWELLLNDDDLQVGSEGHALKPCGPLKPGHYRFVFFGVNIDDRNQNGLASRFKIVSNQ